MGSGLNSTLIRLSILVWSCITLAGLVQWHRAAGKKTAVRMPGWVRGTGNLSADGLSDNMARLERLEKTAMLLRLEKLERELQVGAFTDGTDLTTRLQRLEEHTLSRTHKLSQEVLPVKEDAAPKVPPRAPPKTNGKHSIRQPAGPQQEQSYAQKSSDKQTHDVAAAPPRLSPSLPPSSAARTPGPPLRYRRTLHTGLGDRLSVMLSEAAAASAVGRDVYVFWHTNRGMSRKHHSALFLDEIELRAEFPRNLHILPSEQEFDLQTSNMSDIEFTTTNDPKILPGYRKSLWGLDSAYTTAWRTFKLPDALPRLSRDVYTEAYRKVAGEFRVRGPSAKVAGLPRGKYVVLHVRGNDKQAPLSEFETVQVLSLLPRDLPLVVVSDDEKFLHDILSNESLSLLRERVVTLPKIDQSEPEGKYDAMFRDLSTLLGATGIIQHATNAWSAYSSLAAMMRQIPLINTWIGKPSDPKRQSMHLGTLAGFAREGGCPIELQSANRADEVGAWIERVRKAPVRARADDANSEESEPVPLQQSGEQDTSTASVAESVRFLLVIGPEGSSHSLMSMVFKNSSTYSLLERTEGGLDLHTELQRSLYHHWSSAGLFDWPCRPDHARDPSEVFSRAVSNLKRVERMVLKAAARRARRGMQAGGVGAGRRGGAREIVIPVNSADDNAAGMGSYPNFPAGPGAGRWCQYPDVDAWFEACGAAGVKCSFLVLLRNPDEVIHSTTIRRGFQEKHSQIRMITDMLSIIHTQVQNNLDQPHWCWKYGDADLSGVANSFGLDSASVASFFRDNFRHSRWSDKKQKQLLQVRSRVNSVKRMRKSLLTFTQLRCSTFTRPS